MKKNYLYPIILILVLIAVGLGYQLSSPEIIIQNKSGVVVDKATIKLPSNRVVFESIRTGEEYTIYYSAAQKDGTYDYEFNFANGESVAGQCGYVTNAELGKRLQLTVNKSLKIECTESNKLFW